MGMPLNLILGVINAIQMIVFLPVLHVNFPATLVTFNSMMVQIA